MTINISDLKSSHREDRLLVINRIREQKSIPSLYALIHHLEEETDRSIKEKIGLVLDELLPEAGADLIGNMIRSEDSFIRNCAVESMKKAGDVVVPALFKLTVDMDRDVRKFAIDALTTRDTPGVRSILRDRLSDSDPNVVYTAVEYLGARKDIESAASIEQIAMNAHNNPMLFCSCLEALAKIGTSAFNGDLITYCIKVGENPLFRYSILKYMGSCASYEKVESYILDLIGQSGEVFAKEIIDAMEAICLRDPCIIIRPKLKEVLKRFIFSVETGENRYELAKLLADKLDVEETRAAARLDLKNNDLMVVLAAIEILSKYGQKSDIIAMEKLAEKTDSDEILEAIGDAVEEIGCQER